MRDKRFSLKHAFIVLFALAVVITAGTELYHHRTATSVKLVVEHAENNLQRKEQRVLHNLDSLAMLPSAQAIREALFSQPENDVVYSFAYLKDSLFAWSDNDVLISQDEVDLPAGQAGSLPQGSLLKLRNGWYELFKITKGNYHFYSALLIKHEFAYQNKYLVNSFNHKLKIPDNYIFNTYPAAGSYPVKNSQGHALFYLSGSDATVNSEFFPLSACVYAVVFLLLLTASYSFGRWLLQGSLMLTVLFSFIVIGLRLFMIHAQLPDELYATDFFKPQLYASHAYMNSLGDFLFNVLTALCLLLIFYTGKPLMNIGVNARKILYYPFLLAVIAAVLVTGSLLRGIIFNSSISFNTVNIFELTIYSFVGLLIVGLLMFIVFILISSLVEYERKNKLKNEAIVAIGASVLITLITITSITLFTSSATGSMILFVFLYAGIHIFTPGDTADKNSGYSFFAIVSFLLITSIYSCLSIYIYSKQKEQDNRKLLAGKIETAQDRIGEHLFEDLQGKISSDSTMQAYFDNPATASPLVTQRLRRRYFNGFWTKYEVDAYCFDSLNLPLSKSIDSSGYQQFDAIINNVGRPTYADDLFFLTNAKGKSLYLARIPLKAPLPPEGGLSTSFRSDDSVKKGTIFIELEPKLIQATQGFPELFISDKVVFNKDLANYSYARYQNHELVNQYGDFAYYYSSDVFGKYGDEYTFLNRDGYNHLLYRESNSSLIVVSKKQDSAYTLITSFSYFFIFFSVLLLFIVSVHDLLTDRLSFSLTLKNRIQLSVIAIVVFSIITIGAGTVYYIIKKYDDNQNTSVSNRLKSILVTLENNFAEQLNRDSTLTENTMTRLSRLSSSTTTDFNWYDEGGNLLFSSQPKIFDQGIISPLMNPKALDELTTKEQTQFVHPENIGKLNYIAAYQILRNRQNQLCGYISLPFFEKQNELNRDISAFLSALINIYMVLLSLTVLVTFFIASRITKPLLLIQQKLSTINLSSKNELIQWNKRDEIGELVNEYNKKVEELALSAELLAQSERQSAWQEMAKQVAHEIKNPLTPMKLGVQHLLSAYKNNSPDKEELVKKISQTLIQQIDTLTNIANEFSNFAKMPQPKNEVVDLVTILSDTINLFKESPGITLTFNSSESGVVSSEKNYDLVSRLTTHNSQLKVAEVFADKDQLIRVFSNLLKNAVQSIPSERHGNIGVFIIQKDGYFTVEVQDNGTGIADNQLEKIFIPNFTTKSGGTGLGLAIVKNIVENSGGKVWFKTQIGVGTTFFVSLPALKR